MRATLSLILLFVLAGCAGIEPRQFNGPNARPAYTMTCSESGRTLAACYQKAGELCKSGYTILDQPTNVYATGMTKSTLQGLVVECK
jgi:hypothetical protein